MATAILNKGTKYCQNTFTYYKENPHRLRKELMSGFTVAILQVPESVAFSFVAGVEPLVGLYATVFMGFITGVFGGKAGMISGAAGALAVVAKDLTDSDGPLGDYSYDQRLEHLFLTMVFVGIFQMVAGFLQLARLVKLIPETAMIGFMNGLAIIIFMAQLTAFQTCSSEEYFQDCETHERDWMSLADGETWLVVIMTLFTMFVMWGYPKVPKIGGLLPASLVAVVVTTIFEHAINRTAIGWDMRIVEETAPISGGFPTAHIPNPDDTDWGVVITYAIILGAIGLIESVMTLQAVDEITGDTPTVAKSTQECVAQGLANLVSGLFMSMGGDAMIGQSTINVMNGARGRLSSSSAGVFMLLIIIALHSVIAKIPIAALTGVLFMVVIHTFNWDTFKLIPRVAIHDSIAIVGVTFLAVYYNLAVAVFVGVLWTSVTQSWQSAKLLSCNAFMEGNTKVYHLKGPLFFGSAKTFASFFDPLNDPQVVAVSFDDAIIADFSGVAALRQLSFRYHAQEKHLILRGLGEECKHKIGRTKTWMPEKLMIGDDAKIDELEDVPLSPLVSDGRKKRSPSGSISYGSPRKLSLFQVEERHDEFRDPDDFIVELADKGELEVEVEESDDEPRSL